ncbi:MAG: site-specific DNA-methyltransferase [Actinomycetia bacterium]|nr:site-specific DNA-methyltransferase [Actinomycetes bacterium]
MKDFSVAIPANDVALAQSADLLSTTHRLYRGDARELGWLETESLHLVVTSPPYWTLKEYNETQGQLGAIADYDEFMDELDRVWAECARALVPGGRLVCVVGDVCLSRRKNKGRHSVIPLHADIAVRCRRLGLDYLTPILWHKISNASYEVENGSTFLGKPYEPNAIIKNDIEYILLLRKPGGYRKPTEEQRRLSKLSHDEHAAWFRSFWTDIRGASTRDHPAPYPVELAYRLVRMFSFAGDTVLDPFSGTFSTTIAAIDTGRNSIAVELDPTYFTEGVQRVNRAAARLDLFCGPVRVEVSYQFPPAAPREQQTAC